MPSPCEGLRGESFFEPLPQACVALIPQGHKDYSRVVVAPGFIGHDDESIGHGVEVLQSTEEMKDIVRTDSPGQSI